MYSYKTIADNVRTKIAVGACRFYASLSSCRSEEEARSFLSRVKEELPGPRTMPMLTAWASAMPCWPAVMTTGNRRGQPDRRC